MFAVGSAKKRKTAADRISNLPQNVTQQILECLPLQEAARTSILSSHWKHKWSAISQLVLDEKFFTSILKKNKETTDMPLVYSKVVNNILFSHVGPIWKFVLFLPSWLPNEADISQWIRFAHANGVKEFTLENARGLKKYIPTSLFSCKDLTHLTLIRCKILRLPATFQGFPCLISLRWKMLSKEVSVLETLISKCPQLQSLCLIVYDWESTLSICAPKLKELFVEGSLSNLSMEETTSINKLALDLCCSKFQKSRHMSDFFSTLLKVEKLILKESFWMHLEYAFISPPTLPKELEKLQSLKLVGVPLHRRFSVVFLLCLLLSSPRLVQLYIEVSELETACDEQLIQNDDTCILPCLQKVQLFGISGLPAELQLIKFLLACSPALEKMSIELSTGMGGAQEKFNFATETLRYRRASPNAEIIVKTKKLFSDSYNFTPLWLE
ncbi:hypothetical protein RDABS01_032263 [Bienertia sinuspersici]